MGAGMRRTALADPEGSESGAHGAAGQGTACPPGQAITTIERKQS
jgi:hypothetical protein